MVNKKTILKLLGDLIWRAKKMNRPFSIYCGKIMELQDIKGLLETEINSKPGRGGCPLRKATGEERLSALIP